MHWIYGAHLWGWASQKSFRGSKIKVNHASQHVYFPPLYILNADLALNWKLLERTSNEVGLAHQ